MVLVMPQELEVWYLLPALRRELAIELIVLGLKQSDVSRVLGTSRSAINQYIKSKRAKEVKFDIKTLKAIKKSANLLKNKQTCLLGEMQKLSKLAKQNGMLCKLHKGCRHEEGKCCKICLN